MTRTDAEEGLKKQEVEQYFQKDQRAGLGTIAAWAFWLSFFQGPDETRLMPRELKRLVGLFLSERDTPWRCLIRPQDVIDPSRWHVSRDILYREEKITRNKGPMERSG